MRILVIAPYISNKLFDKKRRNNSGLGLIINTLTFGLSESMEIDVFVPRAKKTIKVGNVRYIGHSIFSNFIRIRLIDIWKIFLMLFTKNISFSKRIKNMYYLSEMGYLSHLIKNNVYNSVMLHGQFYRNYISSFELINKKIPYSIILHGTIYKKEVKGDFLDKRVEGEIVKMTANSNNKIIVISNGVKNEICAKYNINPSAIEVINNGFDVDKNGINIQQTRQEYSIIKEKVVVYVGNFSQNKNQELLIESAVKILRTVETKFIFAGTIDHSLKLKERIDDLGLANKVIFTGYLEPNKISNLYSIADLVVLLSYSEGFGLSIIEGYSFGVPAVFPADFDAAEELYDINCSIMVQNRTISEVSDAVISALQKTWDKDYIIAYSNKFSTHEMIKRYKSILMKGAIK